MFNWIKNLFKTKPKKRKVRKRLTEYDVQEIERVIRKGIKLQSIADYYQVHIRTIYRIKKGEHTLQLKKDMKC